MVDDQLRHETDKPTIGLILCQQPNRLLAEYALLGVDNPIGVSGFELTRVARNLANQPAQHRADRERVGRV